MATGTIPSIQETGTWTPTVSGGDFTTISVSDGKYARLGNFVFASFNWSTISSASGNKYAVVSGLPYSFGSAGTAFGNTYNFSLGTILPSRGTYARINAYFSSPASGQSGTAWVCGIIV